MKLGRGMWSFLILAFPFLHFHRCTSYNIWRRKKQNSKCQNENLLPLPAVFCFFSAPKQMHLCTVYTEGTSIISTAVLLITRYRAMMMMMMCSAYPRNLSVQLSLGATSTTITYMLFLSFSLSKYPIFLGFWG